MTAPVSITDAVPTRRRVVQAIALAWFAEIGLDLLMNAGLFAPFYRWDQPGLLPPIKMFEYIPLGYAAFLLWSIAFAWLVVRTRSYGLRAGARLGATLGGLLGAAAFAGWLSIFAFPPLMLFLWAVDHAVLCTTAGAVIGGSLTAERLRPLVARVCVLVGLCVAVVITMQSLGLAPVNLPQGRIGIGWDPNK